MIDFQDVSKGYGANVLLDHVNFRINSGDRVGVVGSNGSGKTTLFNLITGELKQDSGSILLPRDMRIGYLHQQLEVEKLTLPINEYTADAIPELNTITAELHDIEHRLAEGDPDDDERNRLLKRHGALQSEFEHLGGYNLKPEAEAALCGLGFPAENLARPLKSFSGGWRMRAALARVLISKPDVLLLDEPSNYLDIPAVEWLCRFLRNFPGTLLLISHDRFLLTRLATVTLEINKGQATRYAGNYDFYRRERAARAAALASQSANQERKKEQMQRTIDRFRAKSTKAAQAKSMQKALDRIEDIETLDDLAVKGTLRLPAPPASGVEAARFEGVGFGYDKSKPLFRKLDFTVNAGDKLAFIGYNGTGKTTLLKLLTGKLTPDAGRIVLGHHIVIGYLAQEFADLLTLENSVYDIVKSAARPGFPMNTLPGILGSFGFPGESASKSATVLSGGEKIRLCFARIFVNPPNLLVLDEPTTHLDLAGRETLQQVLQNYQGTLCLVSHDIEFVRNVATAIVAMEPGGIHKYFGNYDYYREKLAAGESGDTAAGTAKTGKNSDADEKNENSRQRRQERARRRQELSGIRRKLETRIAELEKSLERAEKRQAELLAAMMQPPGPDFGALMKEHAKLQQKLTAMTADWEKAVSEQEAFQKEANALSD